MVVSNANPSAQATASRPTRPAHSSQAGARTGLLFPRVARHRIFCNRRTESSLTTPGLAEAHWAHGSQTTVSTFRRAVESFQPTAE